MTSAASEPEPYKPRRTVVLVGLMGAGKSSVGRRLAQRLDLPYVDADREIEAAAGCSIEEIFERHGEAAFREGERRVIARLLGGPVQVLAAGGGAFMNPDIRRRVREQAVSVWLRAELDLLLERCRRRNNRPLLKGQDMRQRLRELMVERYPVYGEADVVVDSCDEPIDTMVERVVSALREYDATADAGRWHGTAATADPAP